LKLPPDPDYNDYLRNWSALYGEKNYDRGLTGFCLRKSHEASEKAFKKDDYFQKVLEVGAGDGEHCKYVDHSFDEYWITDLHEEFLSRAEAFSQERSGKVFYKAEDAAKLSFNDNSFDRVIAAHVLEHLPSPHLALREWGRVLRPGGVITVVLPCDPGCAWRMGRTLVARRKFTKIGFEYDYWMAREHLNPINNLIAFIRFYFKKRSEIWWPFHIPSIDLNLFFIAHLFPEEDE